MADRRMLQLLRSATLRLRSAKPRDLTLARLAWWVPLVGSVLVFLLGVGLSLSNLDIRDEVQAWGLAALAGLAAVGLVLSQLFDCRITRARIGFSAFLAPFGLGRDLEVGDSFTHTQVEYCVRVQDRFKELLLERLAGPPYGPGAV